MDTVAGAAVVVDAMEVPSTTTADLVFVSVAEEEASDPPLLSLPVPPELEPPEAL